MEQLTRERADGKRRHRVHVLRSPLTDYLRYECEWGYAYTSQAGEEIYILDLAEIPRPGGLINEDFWLLDGEHVLVMRYDSEGRLLGGVPLDAADTPRYRRCRDAALAQAQPFGRYWAEHPQFWRENLGDRRKVATSLVIFLDSRACRVTVPSTKREQLSARLRELRRAAGLSSAAAAQAAGFSQSKLSKIETGALLPSFADSEAPCGAYRASDKDRDEVLDLVHAPA